MTTTETFDHAVLTPIFPTNALTPWPSTTTTGPTEGVLHTNSLQQDILSMIKAVLSTSNGSGSKHILETEPQAIDSLRCNITHHHKALGDNASSDIDDLYAVFISEGASSSSDHDDIYAAIDIETPLVSPIRAPPQTLKRYRSADLASANYKSKSKRTVRRASVPPMLESLSATPSKDPLQSPLSRGSRVCPVCSKTFARSDLMKRHYEGQHCHLKPFKCNFCPNRFKRSDHVSSHMQKIHNYSMPTNKGRRSKAQPLTASACTPV